MVFLAALLLGSESDHHYGFGQSSRSHHKAHAGSWWTGYNADDFKPRGWFW